MSFGLSAFGHIPLRSDSLTSPHLPLHRHRASLSAVTVPPSPPRRLRVGRMTTKPLRWPPAVIGCENEGRMRTQSPSLQWRVASDVKEGVT
jgi:hypothetical protein